MTEAEDELEGKRPACGNPNCPWYGRYGTYYSLDAPWCGRCTRLGETLLSIMRHAFASTWSPGRL